MRRRKLANESAHPWLHHLNEFQVLIDFEKTFNISYVFKISFPEFAWACGKRKNTFILKRNLK